MILTTCKYFDLVGNRCSRVTDGKCSDLQDCEFKYIAELKAENDRLKARKDKYYQQTLDDEIQINELLHTLQEIKTIADEDCEFCDDIGGFMDNECRKVRILDLITKAESER